MSDPSYQIEEPCFSHELHYRSFGNFLEDSTLTLSQCTLPGPDQFKKKQNIVDGVIYRPSFTDIKEVNDCIVHCLTQIKLENKLCICRWIKTLTSWT